MRRQPRSKTRTIPADEMADTTAAERGDHIRIRRLALGRSMDFQYFEHLPIRLFCDRMGWIPLITLSEPCVDDFIRVFYANMSYIRTPMEEDAIQSRVQQTDVTLTLPWLRAHLHLPAVSADDPAVISDIFDLSLDVFHSRFPRERVLQRICLPDFHHVYYPSAPQLLPEARLLLRLISYNIIPKKGHFDEISALAYRILFCAMEGIQFDSAALILRYMEDSQKNHRRALPYPGLIAMFLRLQGIERGDRPVTFPERPIDRLTIYRMGVPRAPGDVQPARAKRVRVASPSGSRASESDAAGDDDALPVSSEDAAPSSDHATAQASEDAAPSSDHADTASADPAAASSSSQTVSRAEFLAYQARVDSSLADVHSKLDEILRHLRSP